MLSKHTPYEKILYLTQEFWNNRENYLGIYFDKQGISYTIGVDYRIELQKFGYKLENVVLINLDLDTDIVKIYVALLDEHELSAIKLCVDNVQIIQNRPLINFRNFLRGCFRWILK